MTVSKCVFIFFTVEDWDFLLVDLHYWCMLGKDQCKRCQGGGKPLLVEGVEGLDILNVLALVGSNARQPRSF